MSSKFLHQFKANTVIFNEGDIGDCAYIIEKGRVLITIKKHGVDTPLLTLSAGDIFGEMAILDGLPRSASAKALEDCELIEIPNGSLDLVLFSKPAWAQALMRTLSRRLKRINETLAKTSQK